MPKKNLFSSRSAPAVGKAETSAPTKTPPVEEAQAPHDAPINPKHRPTFAMFTRPTTEFTRALASEIVKNLTNIGQFTSRPFKRHQIEKKKQPIFGDNPILLDTSILIDGRIVPVVNSGFLAGTLLIPEFVLREVQHVADSADMLRRAKGRRGLEAAGKLKGQRVNDRVRTKVIKEDERDAVEVDEKLLVLSKRWKLRLMTVDFNLAQRARASGIKVLNIGDLAQAIKLSVVPGEELAIKITHEGKERAQGVGYLGDGTMVVVEDARDKVNTEVTVVITKVHQTPAGQLFFARLK